MNHQKEAERILDQMTGIEIRDTFALVMASVTQTHAILAVAEQLRIGNLIAATRAGGDLRDDEMRNELIRRAYSGLIDFMENGHLTTYPVLTPEIAEALGIEQS